MIVHCESCGSDFRLPDDRVAPGGTWVRCGNCSDVFQVFPEGEDLGLADDDLALDLGGAGLEKAARGGMEESADFGLDLEGEESIEGGRSGLGRLFSLLFWILGAVVVLALVAVGALVAMDRLGMGKQVVDMVRGWPGLGLVLSQPVTPQGYLELAKVRGVHHENLNAGRILVIKGTVVNRFNQPRQAIMVRARLFDSQGKVVRQAVAYAGSLFTEEELRQLSVEALQKRQASPANPNGAPYLAPPDGSLPFNVVFADVPETVREFSAEAVASEPAPGAAN